jgi:hypothetical protein
MRENRRSRRRRVAPLLGCFLLAGVAAGWLWLSGVAAPTQGVHPAVPEVAAHSAPAVRRSSSLPAEPQKVEPNDVQEQRAPRIDLVVPRIDLAPLDRSDAQFRALVQPLSDHPLVRKELTQSRLIETLVGATGEICEGKTPAHRFPLLRLKAPFAVKGAPESPNIAPESYRRYDALVDAFVSFDAAPTIRLYRELKPLFDQAYADLGYPGGDFDDAVRCAFGRLLETPIVPEMVALRPRTLRYEYAAPELQTLDPIQRHLLRMGPRNVARALAKLRVLKQVWETKVAAREAPVPAQGSGPRAPQAARPRPVDPPIPGDRR